MLKGREILIYLALKYDGDWSKIYNAVRTKEVYSSEEVNKALDSLKTKALTCFDEEYPSFLKYVYCPPFVFFYHGDISLITQYDKLIGVVGSRLCSEEGVEVTRNIVRGIADEYIVVSGLASGIDTVAHKSAIEAGGKTIAVLGSGINYVYPEENRELYEEIKQNHLVISEYPDMVPPTKESFPFRNRLIAALSKAVLLTEASKKSGTMITASFAASFGREVMCVPKTPIKESGCNCLIKDGAHLVENAEDVKNVMEDIKPIQNEKNLK